MFTTLSVEHKCQCAKLQVCIYTRRHLRMCPADIIRERLSDRIAEFRLEFRGVAQGEVVPMYYPSLVWPVASVASVAGKQDQIHR